MVKYIVNASYFKNSAHTRIQVSVYAYPCSKNIRAPAPALQPSMPPRNAVWLNARCIKTSSRLDLVSNQWLRSRVRASAVWTPTVVKEYFAPDPVPIPHPSGHVCAEAAAHCDNLIIGLAVIEHFCTYDPFVVLGPQQRELKRYWDTYFGVDAPLFFFVSATVLLCETELLCESEGVHAI